MTQIFSKKNYQMYMLLGWQLPTENEDIRKQGSDLSKFLDIYENSEKTWYLTPIVLLTVDVPENCVLLSDFDYWHFVLNDGDIIFPYCETAIYSQEEKQKSWENIFDIDCSYDGEPNQSLTTQATLWEIRWEWVIKAENFISR